MNTKRHLAELVLAIMPYAAVAGELTIPNTFRAGTPAVAAEVNANFTAVEVAIDDNALRLSGAESIASANASTVQQNTAAIGALEADIQSQAGRILDFSGTLPVVIDQPGSYVLDRNWDLNGPVDGHEVAVELRADEVTVDLRGFTIDLSSLEILITGSGGTIRNGHVFGNAGPTRTIIRSEGTNSLIDGILLDVDGSDATGILLNAGGRVITSIITTEEIITAISAGPGSVIQGNRIQGIGNGIVVGGSAYVLDNVLDCPLGCIRVIGRGNIVARNIVHTVTSAAIVTVEGDGNLILDNTVRHDDLVEGIAWAIRVNGTTNVLRGNIVSPPVTGSPVTFDRGIVFFQDGNYYGDNLISALVAFDLQGTAQVDLGGNAGL
jgi:hypothetical protein